jgi:hypothetical protein
MNMKRKALYEAIRANLETQSINCGVITIKASRTVVDAIWIAIVGSFFDTGFGAAHTS